jgi:hypothetical protein
MRHEKDIHATVRLTTTMLALAIAATTWLYGQPLERFVGTITALNGNTLTVKTDTDGSREVEVPASAVLKRVEPGQKDLSAAVDIRLADIETGDRVLVKLASGAAGVTPQAAQIVTIKRADVAAKEQKEREDWQLRGVGGLVKSVNSADGAIIVTSGAGTTAKTVAVHVSKATVLKRYAPGSVRFDLAQPAPIDAVHPGDQLRARGEKNAAGTEMAAEEVVSGSFRNISGMIVALDSAASTFVVKDLLTKKPVTVHITADAQMHALPEMMARMLAARLKSMTPSAGVAGRAQEMAGSAPAGGAAGPGGQQYGQAGGRQWAGAGQTQSGSMQQMLNRTPVIQFSDLKKGDAVMLVSTQGTAEVTAITLLSGVEPLLEAPEASQNLLSNWSMGSGGAADAADQ